MRRGTILLRLLWSSVAPLLGTLVRQASLRYSFRVKSLKRLSHVVLAADCGSLMCFALVLIKEDVHVVELAAMDLLSRVLLEVLFLALDAVVVSTKKRHDVLLVEGTVYFAGIMGKHTEDW